MREVFLLLASLFVFCFGRKKKTGRRHRLRKKEDALAVPSSVSRVALSRSRPSRDVFSSTRCKNGSREPADPSLWGGGERAPMSKKRNRKRKKSKKKKLFRSPVGETPCSSERVSQNLAPIWLPHWPACNATISRIVGFVRFLREEGGGGRARGRGFFGCVLRKREEEGEREGGG